MPAIAVSPHLYNQPECMITCACIIVHYALKHAALVGYFKEAGDLSADDLFGTIHSFVQVFNTTLHTMEENKRKAREARARRRETERAKKQSGKCKMQVHVVAEVPRV